MNKNEKRAYEIIELGKQLAAEKRRKSAVIRRTVYSVSGFCATAAIGFGIWNNNVIKESADFEKFLSVSDITEEPSETTTSAYSTNDTTTCKDKSCVNNVTTVATSNNDVTTAVTSDIVEESNINMTEYTNAATTNSMKKKSEYFTTIASTSKKTTTDVTPNIHTSVNNKMTIPISETKTNKVTSLSTTAVITVPTTKQTSSKITETYVSVTNATIISITTKNSSQTLQTSTRKKEPIVSSTKVTSVTNVNENTSMQTIQTTQIIPTQPATTIVTDLPVEPIEYPDAYCICNLKGFIGNNYSSNEKVTVQQEKIGELIGSANVELGYYMGYKGVDDQMTVDAEIYSVDGFSENFTVAVKYADNDDYYIYNNNYYFPKNLDDLINDCGLEDHIEFISAEYLGDDLIYFSVENENVWDMLFDEREITAHRHTDFPPDKYISKLILVCEMPEIYDAPFSIGVSEKGVLTVNLYGNCIAFDIGEDKTNKFINHIIQSYQKEELL